MKFIITIVMLCCFAQAQAEYTCSDVPSLKQTLKNLQSSCDSDGPNHGGGHGGGHNEPTTNCTALGSAGDSPIQAINNCVIWENQTAEACTEHLQCFGKVSSCMALGYTATGPSMAISNCRIWGGKTAAECSKYLRCYK